MRARAEQKSERGKVCAQILILYAMDMIKLRRCEHLPKDMFLTQALISLAQKADGTHGNKLLSYVRQQIDHFVTVRAYLFC